MSTLPSVHAGEVEWDLVRVAFEKNFGANDELGAQCVIYHKGRKVVDLVGSSPNQKKYSAETLQNVFECTVPPPPPPRLGNQLTLMDLWTE
jgi:hypothetical protein